MSAQGRGAALATASSLRQLKENGMDGNGIPDSATPETGAGLASDLSEENTERRLVQHQHSGLRGPAEHRIGTHLQLDDLRYLELFEFNPDGCLVLDRSGVIRDASHAAAAVLRRRKEFLLDKPLAFFLAGSTREFYNDLHRLHHGVETDNCLEVCLQPWKAEPVHVHVAVAAIPNGGNRPTAFLWLLRDISSRKRVEEKLRGERDFANSVIEAAEAFILVVDKQGRIIRCNQYMHRMCGYEPQTLPGRDWSLFLPESDRDGARKMMRAAFREGKTKGGPYALVARDGGVRTVVWSARQLASGSGDDDQVLLVGHDITELQERQNQILQMERLAAIGGAVAALSHESRNALQRGEACLEILRLRLKDRPEDLDLIARVQRAQSDLLRLYEDVRMYAAPVHVERHWCDLTTVWRQAWEQVAVQFPKKKTELVQQTAGVDLRCEADSFRLTQVFRNLLENAFAACGETVRITLCCRETSLAGCAALRVTVRDNGPGLTEEQRRNIFKPFYTTKVKGTGLGTSIARRIIEAHGGRIEASERAEPGTEIVIVLPRTEV
jgi:two-component system sensor kinase FixL